MVEPQVTIVVAPRERFSYTRESLDSIYEHTHTPFKLVYVDGGSPAQIKSYLEAQAREKNFQLIRTEHYLSPNHARNIGLAQVNTKYVVFIDNDVVVTPGWLQKLVECAETTNATIVSPLICQHLPLHEVVHCAGGESGVRVETKDGDVRRRMIEKIYLQGRKVADVRPKLQRSETGLAEFHCMMVRTNIFTQVGMLDEKLLNTKEHVDFCILVNEAGGSVYLEPDSLVTYVPSSTLTWSDMTFYMLRWSDAWELASLYRLRDKWNLTEDDYFKNKYKKLGWRRYMSIIQPLSVELSFRQRGRIRRMITDTLISIDKQLNKHITTRYAQKHLSLKQQPVLQVQQKPMAVVSRN
ncbi:glycosyltransferase family 2 protein [Gloeocapsopsis dulcis]|uniref:Glycosyl transferase family 2 n=1 Tax=Gloeocapsopsis dulcis AAB1 = 1H9 TaxID=1433147 RepID=A0A6N8FZ35_9CHRO|nr:glycosyltransferase [Gloeocapsopsis dulcis]MUL38119.1 glycosyl transferase family 2 [Gloeocapsopsis dulcis AAB1 = 1H9]WNN89381.1 glycosyltransferase [Gloeocapsopsis dulcis]